MEAKAKAKAKETTTPLAKPLTDSVLSGPCATQIKESKEWLESFSYYWTSCKKQQDTFKACPEFNTYLEKQYRKQ